jgi:hypothetical protein
LLNPVRFGQLAHDPAPVSSVSSCLSNGAASSSNKMFDSIHAVQAVGLDNGTSAPDYIRLWHGRDAMPFEIFVENRCQAQVQREIDALNLSIPLLADDEKKNPESSLPRRPKLEMRPWPSLS